jgi:hypothetical protein
MPLGQPSNVFTSRLKVPLKITQACCSLLGEGSSVCRILVDVLVAFLHMAWSNEALGGQAGPSALAVAIHKQLQQAGLYKHLRRVLTDATVQLAVADATPELLLAMQHSPQNAPGDPQQPFRVVLRAAQQSLTLYYLLMALWPSPATPAAWDPSIDTAAMSLALTAAQRASAWLGPLPQDSPEPYPQLQGLLQDTCTAVVQCALRRVHDPTTLQAAGASLTPRCCPLLTSPQYLAALCMAAFRCTHSPHDTAAAADALPAGTLPAVGGFAHPSSADTSHSSSRGLRPQGSSKQGPARGSVAAGSVSSSSQQEADPAGSSSGSPGSPWPSSCHPVSRSCCRPSDVAARCCCGRAWLTHRPAAQPC